MMYRAVVKNAKQLVVVGGGCRPKCGVELDQVEIIENGSMVIGPDGNILAVGSDAEIMAKFSEASFETEIDASGKVILPGLCDAHTHPVWSGDRVEEFAMKLDGATYMDIHKKGGGIGFTVRHTQSSPQNELEELFLSRAARMLKQGTTLMEAKSGYGLELDTELKMLRVLHNAKQKTPMEIVCNYLGAHSVPHGSTPEAATRDIVDNQIPKVKELNERSEISAEFIDVFCEQGVFSTDQSREILNAGKDAGMKLNFHGDELHYTGSAEMGSEIGATAISHLEWVSDEGMKAMAHKGVVGVLLPTTAYTLRIDPPPARKLIDAGVPIALGSDFNPNAHCMSMPTVMNLACVTMRMTMPEALNAATINAAASMARSSTHGSLEVGKSGDFIVLNAPRWEHLIYQLCDPPIEAVYKKGVKVV
eukprot:190564_1